MSDRDRSRLTVDGQAAIEITPHLDIDEKLVWAVPINEQVRLDNEYFRKFSRVTLGVFLAVFSYAVVEEFWSGYVALGNLSAIERFGTLLLDKWTIIVFVLPILVVLAFVFRRSGHKAEKHFQGATNKRVIEVTSGRETLIKSYFAPDISILQINPMEYELVLLTIKRRGEGADDEIRGIQMEEAELLKDHIGKIILGLSDEELNDNRLSVRIGDAMGIDPYLPK